MIAELLQEKQLLPTFSALPCTDAVVCAIDEQRKPAAMALCASMRKAGISTYFVLGERKPKWVYERAEKMNSRKIFMSNYLHVVCC